MKRRSLTDEEQQLWNSVTRNDHKLDAPQRVTHDTAPKKIILTPQSRYGSLPPSWTPEAFTQPLHSGAYAGIDRNTADRFRKGEYPIDATIDLHGMSREKAHIALSNFLHSHYERGSRCLLAITGKGKQGGSDDGNDRQNVLSRDIMRSVLREMLPNWLSEPGLRFMVLAFDSAKQKHGGSGAFYILLRRKR